MLVIRLSRQGGHKRPFYHVVATDSRRPRDSGYIEKLGFYNPNAMGKEETLRLDKERTDYWLDKGGKMSDRVKYLYKSMVNEKDLRARVDKRRDDTKRRIEAAAKKAAAQAKPKPEADAPDAESAAAAPEAEAATEAPEAESAAAEPEAKPAADAAEAKPADEAPANAGDAQEQKEE